MPDRPIRGAVVRIVPIRIGFGQWDSASGQQRYS